MVPPPTHSLSCVLCWRNSATQRRTHIPKLKHIWEFRETSLRLRHSRESSRSHRLRRSHGVSLSRPRPSHFDLSINNLEKKRLLLFAVAACLDVSNLVWQYKVTYKKMCVPSSGDAVHSSALCLCSPKPRCRAYFWTTAKWPRRMESYATTRRSSACLSRVVDLQLVSNLLML